MGQQEYQAGANMAFKAFGIVDQMQQRQMMQQLQEQQMGQNALQMQLIQAQIKAAQDNAEEITKQRATMAVPYENWFKPETKTELNPFPIGTQVQPPGRGTFEFPPDPTMQIPTGGRVFSPPQGATAAQVLQMSPLQEAFRAREYKPPTEEAAIRLKQAGMQSPQGSADIQAYNLAKSQGFPGTLLDFYRDKQAPQKPISMGNAIEAAMNEKFGMGWMNDPETQKQAHLWVGTSEGKQRVSEWAQRLTPPSYTFPVTSEGIVPAISRGPGAGTIGQPTGYRKPLSDAQLSKVGEINTVLKNIEKTKELYGYGTGTEHQEWVGPIAGRKGGLEAKFTGTASPEQVKFYAYVKDMQDALLRARSGAQINEQEYKRLVAFLPEPNLPPSTFKAKLERFQEATQTLLDEKLATFERGGYGVGVTSGGGNFRDRAISELNKRGKIVNEQSIKKAMELLGGK